MVEGIAAATGVARALPPTLALSRKALQKLRLFGTFEVSWLEVAPGSSLTAQDNRDLREFFGNDETRAILSALSLTLLTPESTERASALLTVREFFFNRSQQHWATTSNKWYKHTEEIWQQLVSLYDAATPAGHELAVAAAEYEDFLRAPNLSHTRSSGNQGQTARYVERLAELTADLSRVTQAMSTAAHIKSAIASLDTPPIISYRSISRPATYQDLYVERTLVDKLSGEQAAGLRTEDRGVPYRAVVHGAPGAGKSTFVRKLRQELATDTNGQGTLVLTLRNYASGSQQQSITDFAATDTRAALSLDFSDAEFRDLLTLGLVVVIFDGLDEITDVNQRIEVVTRITAFANQFPPVPILVTSRAIGYERAPLPESKFETLLLDEYSNEQASHYISKWFNYIERPDLIADFENESESVADLKKNPLLLSLLCVLYRERGSLPRRRREVYAQCADLLFHTWDSHRHIGQPEELHANGDRIMQELARWVFKSQSAQNGLSETVIKQSIGGYLRDTAGVEENEARRRAGEFLDFCADRAWLLGTTGTAFGERLFGFTHRTFFEYFTAEALARSTSEPAGIASLLLEAHKKDNTSVLPELLLQAIDEKLDRGASMTFGLVCEKTEDDSLIIQLMEGVPLPATTRAKGFDRILELWVSKQTVPTNSFRMLIALNQDARNQFIRDYLSSPASKASDLFLAAWASADLSNEISRHTGPWQETIERLGATVVPHAHTWYQAAPLVWRWANGLSDMPDVDSNLLVVGGTEDACLGLLWPGLEQAGRGETALAADYDALFRSAGSRARNRKRPINDRAAEYFAELVGGRLESRPAPAYDHLPPNGRWAYLFAAGVIYEAMWNNPDALEQLAARLPVPVQEMWTHRANVAEENTVKTVLPTSLSSSPAWARAWAEGKIAFTVLG